MDKYFKSVSSFKNYKQPEKQRFFSFNKNKAQTKYYVTMTGSKLAKQQHNRNERNWYKIFIYITALCLILVWIGLVIYLPYFQIKRTSINGLNIIKFDEINNYINQTYLEGGKLFPNRNYFLVRPGKIENDLSAKYSLKSIKVTKTFPSVLNIEIEEKITTIIYDNGSGYSLLDKDGTVIKIIGEYSAPVNTTTTSSLQTMIDIMPSSTATTTPIEAVAPAHIPAYEKLTKDNGKLPIIYDTREIFIAEKQTGILDPKIISVVITWQDIVAGQGIGEVKYMKTDNPTAGIRIYMDQPWYLIIDPINLTTEIQIQNLETLLNSKDVKPMEYIDLRFKDRVYWK